MTIKVLVVEDHDDNRAVIKRRLERRGFTVDEAHDGAHAIERALHGSPDCILMDLSMPGMSGLEAFQRIREKQSSPVIALTAHAMEAVRQKCLEAGFDRFVTKPIEFDELVQCINDLTKPS